MLAGGRVEIVDDGRGIGARIAVRLTTFGVDAHAVAQATADASGIIFAKGILDGSASQDDGIAVQRAALEAARTFARRERRELEQRFFVTLQDTGGDFGASGRAGERAWGGGLPGLIKTAAAEWPDVALKAVDVATMGVSPDLVADRVVSELLLGGRDVEVALDPAGGRATYKHRPAPYKPVSARIERGAVLVVSGGARGVTATSLVALCKYGPKLALLGRTTLVDEALDTRNAATDAELRRALLARATAAGLPPNPKELAREAKLILDCREIRANIAALERAGATVSYHPIDVRSADAVRACIDAIRETWGPIKGIIHGAGVLADALLANQNDEQFDRVFGTKVDGLRHLLAATAADPLELLIVFSSVAGRFGNSAQSVYAMANEVLSVVAANERARRSACLVRSLAWGPWDGGMVTPGLAKLFEKAGAKLIALNVGAEALAREVASDDGTSQVVLMNGEPPVTGRPIHGGRTFNGQERFELLVNRTTFPELTGHRITPGGVPVVPTVFVVEWFFRAAQACFPSLVLRGVRDVKVLRGVPVEGFDERGVRLVVQARALETAGVDTVLEMKLLDEHDKPRYAGIVDLGATSAEPPPSPTDDEAPGSGEGSRWSIEQVYSEVLFHRPPFAGIRSLGRVSDEGASAELVGLRAAAGPMRHGAPTAIADGGLQLACIWGLHVLGGVPLPASLGALDLYLSGPIDAPVRCFLKGRRAGQRRVLVDLAYVTETGRLLGTIRDLEMHLPLAIDGGVKSNGAA